MQIILLKDVEKVGYADEIVDVKPGYANNFLIPQGYAKTATSSAKKVLAENIKQKSHKESKLIEDAEKLVKEVSQMTLTIKMKAEGEKIFGSVTAANIAEALEEKGLKVERRDITVPNAKMLGEYEAEVRVYKRLTGIVKFNVVAEE